MNIHSINRHTLRSLLLMIVFAMVVGSAAAPAATASEEDTETLVIYRTAEIVAGKPPHTQTVTIKDPQYTLSTLFAQGHTTSITLERFETAKGAASAFRQLAPPATTRIWQGFFNKYPAKSWQIRDPKSTTRQHMWVADQWLVTATAFDEAGSKEWSADPILYSEALYSAAIEYRLFP